MEATEHIANVSPISEFFYAHEGRKVGPISLASLRDLVATGQLCGTSMVLPVNGTRWMPFTDVPGESTSEEIPVPTPATTPLVPDEFYSDLRYVARHFIVDPTECLPTLVDRFTRRRETLHNKWVRFRAELETVSDRLLVDPKRHLQRLSARFSSWRRLTIGKLGEHVAELSKDYDDPLLCSISLFGTMDHGRLERAHTKLLAWFLDPRKEHDFGVVLLTALLTHLGEDVTEIDAGSVTSKPEFPIADDKRLDVYVEGSWNRRRRWLIVEAKVNAREGEGQLKNYDDWIADKLAEDNVVRVFLTPEGRPPGTSKKWLAMSFLDLASTLRSAMPHLKEKSGYHFLRYYVTGVLKDVCRWNLPVPISNLDDCVDPYGILRYLKSLHAKPQ